VAESFAVLAARGQTDPKWKAHAIALGAEPGMLSMRVTAGSTFSSFRAPSAFGLFDELRALKFELVGLYPVTRDGRGSVIEVDCLMQRGAVPAAVPRSSPDLGIREAVPRFS